MVQNRMFDPNLKEFIYDSAQNNVNVVSIVYGTRDPSIVMVDSERTCLFH